VSEKSDDPTSFDKIKIIILLV